MNTYLALEVFDNAIKYFEDAVKVDPDIVNDTIILKSVFGKKKWKWGSFQWILSKVKENFDASLKLDEKSADTHVKMANYWKLSGEIDK